MSAAEKLRSRLEASGEGVSFLVLQRQVLHQTSAAPELRTDADPSPEAGAGPMNVAYMTRGFARDGVLSMEIRAVDPSLDAPSFEDGLLLFRVLTKDDQVWRDEGEGFYTVDDPPGLGMDPASISRLPALLEHLEHVVDLGEQIYQGDNAHRYRGEVAAVRWPGIIAADALAFTESPLELDAWIGQDGELVGLAARTSNLNEEVNHVSVIVNVSFGRDVPPLMPAPIPLRPPTAPQPVESGASSAP